MIITILMAIAAPAGSPAQEPPKPSAPKSDMGIVPSPSFKRVFLELPTDAELRAQMARERPKGPPPPTEPRIQAAAKPVRDWTPLPEIIEPSYLCYGRLYFEQLNSERYGWDLGWWQPIFCAGVFLGDVVTLPYHAGTEPLRQWECNAGYCLPGDPVPFLWYPPEASATGAVAEAAAIGLLIVIFP
jgi:hypothetical protein